MLFFRIANTFSKNSSIIFVQELKPIDEAYFNSLCVKPLTRKQLRKQRNKSAKSPYSLMALCGSWGANKNKLEILVARQKYNHTQKLIKKEINYRTRIN